MSPTDPPLDGELNGIPDGRRELLRETLADARGKGAFSGPWRTSVAWAGGFRAAARTRGHQIPFDEPGDLAAGDSAATPHEHVLSAMGACLVAGVVLHATLQEVRLRAVEVDVSGTFDNLLKWGGPADAGNPGYRSIEVRGRISGDASDDALRDIWERALAGSPVAQTVSQPTPVVAVMDILDPAV